MSPEDFEAEQSQSYIDLLHGKDGLPPTTPYALGPETPVGEGMVDFRRVLTMLRDLGYDRYIIIEREISGARQLADIQKAKAYFEQLVAEVYAV